MTGLSKFGDEYGPFQVFKDPCFERFEPKDDLMYDPPINYENEWDHVVMKKVIVVEMGHFPSKNEK